MKTTFRLKSVVLSFVALVSVGQAARAQAVFTNNPFPSVQYPGTIAHFSAPTNSGFTASGVYWQVNTSGNWVNLSDGLQTSGSTVIGSLTTALAVSNISVADAGSYQLVFTNATTTSNTPPVTLSLLAPPAANSFAAAALSYNPVAFWPLNESSTNPANGGVLAYDVAGGFTGIYQVSSENGYNGVSGPSAPAYPGFPANNFALGDPSQVAGSGVATWGTPTFEGPNATPAVTGAAAANGTNTTFVAWIYPTQTESQYATWLLSRSGYPTTISGISPAKRSAGYRTGSADVVTYVGLNNSSTTYNFAGPVFPLNTWSMVAVVITPTNASLYCLNTNGIGANVQTIAEDNEPWGYSAFIGTDPEPSLQTSRTFVGNIADVLLYNSSFSALQVVNLYAAGAGSQPPIAVFTGLPLSSVQYPGTTAHFGAQTNTVSLGAAQGVYWQINTSGNWVNLSDGLQASGSTVIGSLTTNLTISNISVADAGSYQMVFTNAIITTNTPPVTLSLIPLPATNSFAGVALSYNPVAFWPLNETSTNPANGGVLAYDVAGGFTGIYLVNSLNGNTGIAGPEAPDFAGFPSNNFALGAFSSSLLNGVVTWSTPTFEGPNATPAVTGPAAANGTNVTFVAWIYPTEPEPEYAAWLWMRVGVFGATRTDGFRVQGQTNTPDTVTYTWDNNDPNTYEFIGPGFPINTWSMVAVVITPTNSTMYCYNTNGVTTAFQTYPEDNKPWGNSACIGNDPGKGSSYTFIGSMANVLLYNSSLSQGQLGYLFAVALAQGSVPPIITTAPVSSEVYAGRNAELSVIANGLGQTLSYQWQVYTNGAWVNVTNGNGISGANNPTLSFGNVPSGTSASYQVVISSVLGSVTNSTPATVTGVAYTTLPAYPQAVSNLNPVAYWRLGESGAGAYDLWGGFTGTYGAVGQGLPKSGPDSPAFPGFEITNTGISITNAAFGGEAGGYVAIPPLNLNTNALTITAWIYPTNSPELDTSAVFYSSGNGTKAGLYFPAFNSDLGYNWNDATTNWDSGLNVPDSMWSFVALVITPSDGAVYVYNANGQGAALNTANRNAVLSFYCPSAIGDVPNDTTGASAFNGYIDEVAVFNQALTEDQINALYKVGSGQTPSVVPYIASPLPNPMYVNGGSAVVYTIGAFASSNATYVWTLNGVTLTNGNNGFAGTLFSGATTAALTISNYTGALTGLPIQVAVYNPNVPTPATSSVTLPPCLRRRLSGPRISASSTPNLPPSTRASALFPPVPFGITLMMKAPAIPSLMRGHGRARLPLMTWEPSTQALP